MRSGCKKHPIVDTPPVDCPLLLLFNVLCLLSSVVEEVHKYFTKAKVEMQQCIEVLVKVQHSKCYLS